MSPYKKTPPDLETLHSDQGLTLVELLIASALFAIIAATVFVVINNFQTAQSSVSVRAQASSEGMTVFNRMSKDIRNANTPSNVTVYDPINSTTQVTLTSPIVFASPTELILYTTDGSALATPILVEFLVTGPTFNVGLPTYTLTEYQMVGAASPLTLVPSTLSGQISGTSPMTISGTTLTTRLTASYMVSPSVFSYYPVSTSGSVNFSTPSLVPTTGVLNPPTPIEQVGITAQFQPIQPSNAPVSATVSNVIELRNVTLSLP